MRCGDCGEGDCVVGNEVEMGSGLRCLWWHASSAETVSDID